MRPVQDRGLGIKFNLLFVLFTFLAHRFLPKYDIRMQLLMFQIKMLRDLIDDQRIVPTPEERAELIRLGNEINYDVADVMLVVKPQTYHRWLSPKAKTRSPKPTGCPSTAEDIIALILRMATENLSWGYKRILGELKKLGNSVGLTTIRDILKRSDCPPPPEKTKSKPNLPWSNFVSAHMESLVACDFFTKPVYTLRGRFDAYVLVFLHLGSRRVYLSKPTFHPDEAWVMQQARNVTMRLDDHSIEARYLIHDRDTKFTRQFDAFWKRPGCAASVFRRKRHRPTSSVNSSSAPASTSA
jgi:putative transposase